jgi:hypothetical protein
MAEQLGVVLTGRADHSSYAHYESHRQTLARLGIKAIILDSWMWPDDLEKDASGFPVYDFSSTDYMIAIQDCIDDNKADDVVLVGFCAGGEAALRYGGYDRRVTSVIAIASTTWYRFPDPWDRAVAKRKSSEGRQYAPLIKRRTPYDEQAEITFRLSPDLYSTIEERYDLAWQLGYTGRDSPYIYYVALNGDMVCSTESVQRLYQATRAPAKGYIGLEGVGHDYRNIPALIGSVDLAIEKCLESEPTNEVWGIAYQAAKRVVAKVLREDPNNYDHRDDSLRVWELLAYDFPSLCMHEKRSMMYQIRKWYQTGWEHETVASRTAQIIST